MVRRTGAEPGSYGGSDVVARSIDFISDTQMKKERKKSMYRFYLLYRYLCRPLDQDHLMSCYGNYKGEV